MKKSLLIMILLATIYIARGQTYSYRYWLDKDYSTMKSGSCTNSGAEFDIDLSSLTVGIHAIHIQAGDATGNWGSVSTRFFFKAAESSAVAVKGRYWFDNDVTTMHNDVAVEGLIDIDVSALSDGLHIIHYQTQNADGDYSPVNSRLFSVVRPPLGDAKCVKLWIDNSEPTVYDLPKEELLIDVSNLSVGTHDLHIVLLDVNGFVLDEQTQQFDISSPDITFADAKVKAICVADWDTNEDGELSEEEAAAVTSLNGVFYNNEEITSLDELQYFTGLTAVSDIDFFFCTSLVSMTLPKNIAEVPETTFTGCESLTDLKVAEGNEYYCTIDGLLYDKNVTLLLFCPTKKTGTVAVPATVKRIGTNGFYECAGLTAITLPNELEELGDAVFVGCTSLTTIHFPASVKSMGLGQFTQCSNLESITVDEANDYFQSIDGVLYTKSDLTLKSYPNKKGKEFIVAEGTAIIEDFSFCTTEVEKVTLPASIEGIGYLAFGYCENLKTIVSLNPAPTAAGIRSDIMSDEEYKGITLMVPYGTKSLYEASNGWNKFTNIVEMAEVDAINNVVNNQPNINGNALIFTIDGRRVDKPKKSVNIIRMNDGTTRKIIVK